MNHTPPSKIKYILYARKSSEGEDRQIQSIDDQIARLKELASSLGLEVIDILTEAKSAKKPYIRPVFTELVTRIERGEANGILSWHLNRLSRNPVDSGTLGWMLQQGVLQSIQTTERQYLPDDNMLLFSVEAGMANQYIIELRKACMRGMDRKAELGWKPGMAPMGYINYTKKDEENIIIPDPYRFNQVRQMWDLMLTGNYTPQAIRTIANKQWGFKTLKHKTKGGVAIPLFAIYALFDNIFYTGMFRWKGKLFQGKHTPMITLAEFDKVQTLLKKRSNPRPQENSFAYTGLIRCNSCHMMFTATQKQKMVKTLGTTQTYVYYHCSRKSKSIQCTNPPISLKDLESHIEKELERFSINPQFLEFILKSLENEKQKANANRDNIRAMQQKALRDSQKQLENLTRMRYQDLIDDIDFIKERKLLKDQLTKLQVQLNDNSDNSEKWNQLTKNAFHFAAYARHVFNNGSIEVKRSIFSCFGSNYAISNGKLLFETAFWLIPIRKAYAKFIVEYQRLELQNLLDSKDWMFILPSRILVGCATAKEVRKAIETNNDTTLHIPHLDGRPPPDNNQSSGP